MGNYKKSQCRWKDEFYVLAYIYRAEGATIPEICSLLGCSMPGMKLWKRQKPALEEALRLGREKFNKMSGGTGKDRPLRRYIYGHLPRRLRPVWRRLEGEWERGGKGVEGWLRGVGKRGKDNDALKYLFLHAVSVSHFNPSTALRRLGLPKGMLDRWLETDKDFMELVEEVMWHKKNFFESKLVELVEQGDTAAVMMVNKTVNRDRGYGERMEVEHRGSVLHEHKHEHKVQVRLEELPLKVGVKRELLRAMERAGIGEGELVVEGKFKEKEGKFLEDKRNGEG